MSTERFPGIRRVLRLGVERRELEEELVFHFDQTVEELMATGRSREAAEAEARRRFGDERRYRRELEEIDGRMASARRWAQRWEVVSTSLELAIRRIRSSPGFALAVVLTFALGIGANATMFGVVDRLLLRPPAHVDDPGAVRRILISRINPYGGESGTGDALSYPAYQDLTRARSFSGVAGYAGRTLTVGSGGTAEQVSAEGTTPNYFSVLGVEPAVGRFYTAEEDRKEAPGVVVISYGYWRSRFGGSRDVLGRTVDFGYGPHTVIGVAPRGFTGINLGGVDLWMPARALEGREGPGEGCLESRDCWWLRVVARLAPGASVEQAEAEATRLFLQGQQQLETERSELSRRDDKAAIVAAPLIAARGPMASGESVVVRWLAGISLIVLLIACANVANLLLARSIRQRREIGVRLALGSSRGRVVGQVLMESLLLSMLGGAAALALAHWGGAVVGKVLLPDVAWGDGGVDPRVAWFVLAITPLTGLTAGLLPALQASRPAVYEVLRSSARNASTPVSRTRDALTVVQAALSVVLLVGAGLFVRSLWQVQSLDLGLEPEGVLMIAPVFQPGVPQEQRDRFAHAAVERLREHPEVERAAASQGVPFWSVMMTLLRVPGLDPLPRVPGGGPFPFVNAVTVGYFDVFGLDIREGRSFTSQDGAGATPVAVVNETMARTLWPQQSALGKCLIVNDNPAEPGSPPCTEVVGVVENSRRNELIDEPEAMQYFLHTPQLPTGEQIGLLLVRSRGADAGALIPDIQRELLALDPRVRFVNVRPFQELIAPGMRSWTLGASMFSAFGILALLVAGIGLYSVLAFSVAQRTFELGIRSALGATRERLVSLVLRHALRLAGVGVVLGLAVAVLAAPRVESLLYGVSPRDPATLTGVAVVLLAVALLAGGIPAWRATRVNPSVALRSE